MVLRGVHPDLLADSLTCNSVRYKEDFARDARFRPLLDPAEAPEASFLEAEAQSKIAVFANLENGSFYRCTGRLRCGYLRVAAWVRCSRTSGEIRFATTELVAVPSHWQ